MGRFNENKTRSVKRFNMSIGSDPLNFNTPKIKGCYVFNPFETKLQRNIIAYFNERLELRGYLPYTFPSIGLLSHLELERSFYQLNNECFKIDKNYYLKPTSEAIAYPFLARKQFRNFKFYSVGSAFRNETRQCKKFVRHRQIAFFHEAHAIVEEQYSEKTFDEAVQLYDELFMTLQIPVIKSYRPQEDRFPGAEKTLAYDCSTTGVQLASIHLLHKTFLEAFEVDCKKRVICFGFTQRVQGSLKSIPIALHPYPLLIVKMEPAIKLNTKIPTVLYDKSREPFSHFMTKIEEFYQPLIKIKIGTKELSDEKITITTSTNSWTESLALLSEDNAKNYLLSKLDKTFTVA